MTFIKKIVLTQNKYFFKMSQKVFLAMLKVLWTEINRCRDLLVCLNNLNCKNNHLFIKIHRSNTYLILHFWWSYISAVLAIGAQSFFQFDYIRHGFEFWWYYRPSCSRTKVRGLPIHVRVHLKSAICLASAKSEK